jgi:hypothetical protein
LFVIPFQVSRFAATNILPVISSLILQWFLAKEICRRIKPTIWYLRNSI